MKLDLAGILALVLPYIVEMVKSHIIPKIKRLAYEKLNDKVDKLIIDLAQNASKIKDAEGAKKEAYIEGTKLGIETLRAISEKLAKAADEIEKAL